MSLPPCVMRQAQPFPGGRTKYFCAHPQYPYRSRFLATIQYCETCPLRQETGEPPAPATPPTPLPSKLRPDLQALALTLPPPDDVQRSFSRPVFEPSGAIVYPAREGDWEPPQNINGYVRDSNNPRRFLPLWLPCALRLQSAFLKAACGCIDITMKCNQPRATTFTQAVTYDVCQACPHRSK